jgi:uncharacterized cupredoxin-like copper-binding protein
MTSCHDVATAWAHGCHVSSRTRCLLPRTRLGLLFVVTAVAAACSSAGGTAKWTYNPAIGSPPAASAAPSGGSPSPAANASAAPSASAATNTIDLTEWKVAVATTMTQGTSTFTISNLGTIPHELLVFKSDLEPSAYPVDAAGDIQEEGAGVTLLSDGDNIDPAGSQVRAIDLAPGTYLFVCNIPGHFKAGMFTVVRVTS